MTKVFVYGSLRQGMLLHNRVLADSTFPEEGTISGFDIGDIGGFPVIKAVENGGDVLGEVYYRKIHPTFVPGTTSP